MRVLAGRAFPQSSSGSLKNRALLLRCRCGPSQSLHLGPSQSLACGVSPRLLRCCSSRTTAAQLELTSRHAKAKMVSLHNCCSPGADRIGIPRRKRCIQTCAQLQGVDRCIATTQPKRPRKNRRLPKHLHNIKSRFERKPRDLAAQMATFLRRSPRTGLHRELHRQRRQLGNASSTGNVGNSRVLCEEVLCEELEEPVACGFPGTGVGRKGTSSQRLCAPWLR